MRCGVVGKSEKLTYAAHEPSNKRRGGYGCPCAGLVVRDDEVIARSLQADAIKVYSLCVHCLDFEQVFSLLSTQFRLSTS